MDVSLIFGIIFTIIVISIILVFGGGVIADLFGFGGEAQVLKSIDNLQNKIGTVYTLAKGSSDQFALSFSKDYKLCFFNSTNPQKHVTAGWDPDSTTKYLINASHYNVWYYKGTDDAAGRGKRIPHLDMATEKNFCVTGGSKVYIVSKGDGVEIEPA